MSDAIILGQGDEGAVSLDVNKLIDSRMLVQANSGGGKSYLFRLLCERANGKVPFIVLDPEGEFASLREKIDAVLIGSEGEVPTDIRSAALLARKLIELRVSAVIDLYELKLPQRREYVRLFLDSLVNLPRSLWHPTLILLDEAHIFCPERGSAGRDVVSTQSVIDLMTLGRKRGFAGILATQRFSKLHNDAMAETQNVFIGRTWLADDQKRAGEYLGFSAEERRSLRNIKPGTFFCFGPAVSIAGVNLFQTDKVMTTHPKAGERHKIKPPKASDAVKQIVSQIEGLPEQAETEIRELSQAKQKIVALERELRQRPVEKVPEVKIEYRDRIVEVFPKSLAKTIEFRSTNANRMFESLVQHAKNIQEAVEETAQIILAAAAEEPAPKAKAAAVSKLASFDTREYGQASNGAADIAREASKAPVRTLASFGGNVGNLPEGEKKILIAISQTRGGADRTQISILTGYKRSSRDAYISRLSSKGLVENRGGVLFTTAEGVNVLGSDFEQLPTGDKLREYWLGRLPEGERRILSVLASEYPRAVERQTISEATDYKRSSRDAYISRLNARKLIETSSNGVKAADILFG